MNKRDQRKKKLWIAQIILWVPVLGVILQLLQNGSVKTDLRFDYHKIIYDAVVHNISGDARIFEIAR